jgi:hypothetical protein
LFTPCPLAIAARQHEPVAEPTHDDLLVLGTIWGPHVMHATELHACSGTFRATPSLVLTCDNAYLNVLGVKGSWVQIPPARQR